MPTSILVLAGLMAAASPPEADNSPARPAKATIEFHSDDSRDQVPERFRLKPHRFEAEVERKYELQRAGVEVFAVRFPSPVETEHPENNTVYCEFYRPSKPGKYPAVIVLDILDGKQIVSRGEAVWLAQHDVAAMVLVMPYYGPRRPLEGRLRMLSTDVSQSLENVRQAVLDCRRATAWLVAQPEVDSSRIGVVGTSLGSFIGGIVAAAEPKISSACLLLGGGALVDSFYDHPQARLIVQGMGFFGIGKDYLNNLIGPADPITYAEQLKQKRLLLIGASRDEVVPPVAMERLWKATGEPKLIWVDATHVGAAAYAFPMMREVIRHLKNETEEGSAESDSNSGKE